eukprot:COSAG02_NODE_244_length_27402_cov_41.050397_21_plen_71_part_00
MRSRLSFEVDNTMAHAWLSWRPRVVMLQRADGSCLSKKGTMSFSIHTFAFWTNRAASMRPPWDRGDFNHS